MIPSRMTVQALFILVGLVFFVVGLPLAGRRIRPNWWYGVRIRATLKDETIWYEVNERAGRDMMVLGLALLVLAFALPGLAALPVAEYAAVCGAACGAGSIVMLVRSVRLATRLWRERHGPGGPGGS